MFTIDDAVQFTLQNLVIDIHAHPVLKTYLFNHDLYHDHVSARDFNVFYPLQMQSDLPKLLKGGVNVQISSIYLPESAFINSSKVLGFVDKMINVFHATLADKMEKNQTPDQPFLQTLDIIKGFEQKVKEAQSKGFNAVIARSRSELDNSLKAKQTVFLHAIEGSHSLGRSLSTTTAYLDNLKEFYDQGVCLMTLAHLCSNDIACQVEGIPPSFLKLINANIPIDLTKGLSDIGEEVLRNMLEMGIIVDLTHCTPKGRERIYEINNERKGKKRPLVFSHVGVRKLCPLTNPNAEVMNPDDDEIRRIRDCNGVIGMIFDNYWLFGVEEKRIFEYNPAIHMLINTVDHMKSVTGTYDNVSIGSDFDGFTDPSDDLKDASKLPYLTQALLNHGIPEDDVKKIIGGNAMRVLTEGWGK